MLNQPKTAFIINIARETLDKLQLFVNKNWGLNPVCNNHTHNRGRKVAAPICKIRITVPRNNIPSTVVGVEFALKI
jgi:hypothetical protein